MTATKGTEVVKHERPKYVKPLNEIETLFGDMFRRPFPVLSPAFWPEFRLGEFERAMPTVDMYEEGSEIVLRADLPGLDKKDIEISVTSGTLTISGNRKKEEQTGKGNYFRYERSHSSFYRTIELPAEIDTERIKAHLEKGILEIRLPKIEEAKKKIKNISIT